jgi:hypothetical protein
MNPLPASWQRRLVEAFDELWQSLVDPAEAVCDVDGLAWNRLGGFGSDGASGVPFADEHQLAAIRDQCRALAVANEFAINGHENRISFIVGSGHSYRAVTRHGPDAEPLVRRGVPLALPAPRVRVDVATWCSYKFGMVIV